MQSEDSMPEIIIFSAFLGISGGVDFTELVKNRVIIIKSMERNIPIFSVFLTIFTSSMS
jgi:hypothetical protein